MDKAAEALLAGEDESSSIRTKLFTGKVIKEITGVSHTMKYIGKAVCIALAAVSIDAYAGIRGPTAHSRANCGNNESITWWRAHPRDWRVVSFHNYDKDNAKAGYHYIDTGMGHTWRQAAVHWGESGPTGKYLVTGFHYFYERGQEILDVTTTATNCSIYDGWWD